MANKLSLKSCILGCAIALASVFHPAFGNDNPTVEFCLEGEFDLGLRQQGFSHEPDEFYPMKWCVTYETAGGRVQFSNVGNINADAKNDFTVRYLPNNALQIMDPQNQPVVSFVGAVISDEASAHIRIDPTALIAEVLSNKDSGLEIEEGKHLLRFPGSTHPVVVTLQNDKVLEVASRADLPLRGTTDVVWKWDWSKSNDTPSLILSLGDSTMFKATSSRRQLSEEEAKTFWASEASSEIHEIPGKVWPSSVNMSINTVSAGIHIVNGVRTGFNHLVVETEKGLVVFDAPAGWVEMQQIPPADLVPGLGVSGLSELFVDFLHRQFPNLPINAVLLSHFHDDHAGGARAFAAAGAKVYGPKNDIEYLNAMFNQSEMPMDRMTHQGKLEVLPINDDHVFGEKHQRVEVLYLNGNPHARDAIAAWLPSIGLLYVSDIKVPRSEDKTTDPFLKKNYCWFANWAKEHLPEKYSVMDSHSRSQIESQTIAQFSKINQCSA